MKTNKKEEKTMEQTFKVKMVLRVKNFSPTPNVDQLTRCLEAILESTLGGSVFKVDDLEISLEE